MDYEWKINIIIEFICSNINNKQMYLFIYENLPFSGFEALYC